ncbi:unnamed protein product [Debaryomyces tyrocola]|nr:unnamed protein product [Debaryomyces tyrocola]
MFSCRSSCNNQSLKLNFEPLFLACLLHYSTIARIAIKNNILGKNRACKSRKCCEGFFVN